MLLAGQGWFSPPSTYTLASEDEAALLGSEKRDHVGHLLRAPDPAQGHTRSRIAAQRQCPPWGRFHDRPLATASPQRGSSGDVPRRDYAGC
jgi:hypothetical protein